MQCNCDVVSCCVVCVNPGVSECTALDVSDHQTAAGSLPTAMIFAEVGPFAAVFFMCRYFSAPQPHCHILWGQGIHGRAAKRESSQSASVVPCDDFVQPVLGSMSLDIHA